MSCAAWGNMTTLTLARSKCRRGNEFLKEIKVNAHVVNGHREGSIPADVWPRTLMQGRGHHTVSVGRIRFGIESRERSWILEDCFLR